MELAPDIRQRLEERLARLRERRDAVVDQIGASAVASASISGGGGGRSYTDKTAAERKAELAILDKEIARVEYALGLRDKPGSIRRIYARFR